MKQIILFALFSASVFGQAYRVDPTPVFTTTQQSATGTAPVLAVSNAQIQIYTSSSLTPAATTYTDATGSTACPTSQPVVLRGTNVCTSAADANGNFGFWLAAGTYYYTITPTASQFVNGSGGAGPTQGPFPLSVGGGGSGSGLNPPASGTGLIKGASGSQTTTVAAASDINSTLGYTPAAVSSCSGYGAGYVLSAVGTSSPTCILPSTGSVATTPLVLKGNNGGSAIAAVPSSDFQAAVSQVVGVGSINTSIAAAATACGLLSSQCIAQVPTNYAGADTPALFSNDITVPDQSGYSSNTIIQSQQSGIVNYYSNNANYLCSVTCGNQATTTADQFVYWANQTQTAPNVFFHVYKGSILAGGHNWNNGTYVNISNYQPYIEQVFMATDGQTILKGLGITKTGNGDVLLESDAAIQYGGLTGATTEEGVKPKDFMIGQGPCEFLAPIATGGSNVHQITLGTPTQCPNTIGEDRWYYSTVGTYSTGTVTAQTGADFATNPVLLTGSGTGWSVSSAIGVIGATTNVGPVTVTPIFSGGGCSALNVSCSGSASSFSTGQLACISDRSESEMVYPTAISGGQISYTAIKPHLAGAEITTGGECGKVLDFVADRVISSTFGPINGNTVVGTLHRMWMVISTPSATSMQIAVQGKGYWRGMSNNSNWSASNISNSYGYTLWPAARVVATSATPGLYSGKGGPIQLADNNVTWSTNDATGEAMGAAVQVSGGFGTFLNWFPNFSGASGGNGITYSFLQGSDIGESVTNLAPAYFYQPLGGTHLGAAAFKANGYFGSLLNSQYATQYPAFNVGCYYSGCSGKYPVLSLQDIAGYENFGIDQTNNEFYYTTNNGANTYYLNGSGGSMVYPSAGIPLSTGSAWGTSYAAQGTDTKLMTSGTVSGTSSLLCTDANGGATTSGCPSAALPTTGSTNGQYAPIATVTGGTPTSSYTATLITPLPTCASMASGVISGPCITPSGASGFFEYVDVQTGTSYNIPASDAWGTVTFSNASAVSAALPQAGLSSNYPAGSYVTITNLGAGTLTISNSGSSTINGQSTRVIAAATGSGASLVTHSCKLISNGTNYLISFCN